MYVGGGGFVVVVVYNEMHVVCGGGRVCSGM